MFQNGGQIIISQRNLVMNATLYRVVQKQKRLTFLIRFLTSSVNLILISVNNGVSSICHENGNGNNDIVFELHLLEKVNEFLLCRKVENIIVTSNEGLLLLF